MDLNQSQEIVEEKEPETKEPPKISSGKTQVYTETKSQIERRVSKELAIDPDMKMMKDVLKGYITIESSIIKLQQIAGNILGIQESPEMAQMALMSAEISSLRANVNKLNVGIVIVASLASAALGASNADQIIPIAQKVINAFLGW